jgi:hypothetical protein
MPHHGLFLGEPALVLALTAKMARLSLTSAARRAIAKRWSSGVAPGLPQERLSDSEWGFGREAVPLCAVLRGGGQLCERQWKTKEFKMPG